MYFDREFLYIFVYCFSCRYLVELGLRQVGLLVYGYYFWCVFWVWDLGTEGTLFICRAELGKHLERVDLVRPHDLHSEIYHMDHVILSG